MLNFFPSKTVFLTVFIIVTALSMVAFSTTRPQAQQSAPYLPHTATPKAEDKASTPSSQPTQTTEQNPTYANLRRSYITMDWLTRKQMSARQKNTIAFFMTGKYVEPNWFNTNLVSKHKAQDKAIYASAEFSRYFEKNKIGEFRNAVLFEQEKRQITSDIATIDQDKFTAHFMDRVIFREPNFLVMGSSLKLNTKTQQFMFNKARYLIYNRHIRGFAKQLRRDKAGKIYLEQASYTSCPPGCNSWLLYSNHIELNPKTGIGTAHGATLLLDKIPVFYFPYMRFSIDHRRQSGFLYPSFGYDKNTGFSYTQPFYLSLAANLDATLTPKFLSKRGLLLETQVRHLSKHGFGSLDGGYLHQDPLKYKNRNFHSNRWFIHLHQSYSLSANWDMHINYSKASDKDYLDDFDSLSSLHAQPLLTQQFITRYQGGQLQNPWSLTFNAERFQNLYYFNDAPYDKLPQLVLQGQNFLTRHLRFSYLLDLTNFSRDKDWKYLGVNVAHRPTNFDLQNNILRYDYGASQDNILANSSGLRFYTEGALHFSFARNFGFVRPTLALRSVSYHLRDLQRTSPMAVQFWPQQAFTPDSNRSTTVPYFSIDAGLYFERSLSLHHKLFIQTLEPRVFYLYAPFASGQENNPLFDTQNLGFSVDSLWRASRFSGYDRLQDANQLSLGLSTAFLDDQGQERLRAEVGQIFYFAKRRVLTDPFYGSSLSDPGLLNNIRQGRLRYLRAQKTATSPVAARLSYHLNQQLSLESAWAYDVKEHRNAQMSMLATWSPDPFRIINLGYTYSSEIQRTLLDADGQVKPRQFTDGNIHQTNISFLWPLTQHWSMLGDWVYDLTHHKNLERLIGAERQTDCYTLRLVWRHYTDARQYPFYTQKKDGIYLQFVLRGLGTVGGTSVKSLFEKINGYQQREQKIASYY